MKKSRAADEGRSSDSGARAASGCSIAGRVGYRLGVLLAVETFTASLLVFAPQAPAQCSPGWTGYSVVGDLGAAFSIARMSNGDVIAGGYFYPNGGADASTISRWNGAAWSPLGLGGPNSNVMALAVFPRPGGGEDLYAGGLFSGAENLPGTTGIARWNGAAWSSVGGGTNGNVRALARMPNGDLIAAGAFNRAAGFDVEANRIARWDGASWHPLGEGIGGLVYSLAVMQNGDLIAGGNIHHAGGQPVNGIARWNGANWASLGLGITGGGSPTVNALLVLPNGDLIAGSNCFFAGGAPANYIARWDGSTWSAFPTEPDAQVTCLAALPDAPGGGDFVAGGDFFLAGPSLVMFAARWTSTGGINGSWSALGSGLDNYPFAMVPLPGSEVLFGGQFLNAGGATIRKVARYTFGGTAPKVTTQPSDSAACADGSALFVVAAASVLPVTYQWQIQTAPPPGATWASLGALPIVLPCGGTARAVPGGGTSATISVAACPNVKEYKIRCVASNTCGNTMSNEATLSVCAADLDCDGLVEDADFSVFVIAYNILDCTDPSMAPGCLSDFNRDGVVDDADFGYFIVAYNALLCP